MRPGIHFGHPDEAQLLLPEASSLGRFHLFGSREAGTACACRLGRVRQRPRPVGPLCETSDRLDDHNRVRALRRRRVLRSAAIGQPDLGREHQEENHLTANPLAGMKILLSLVRVAFTHNAAGRPSFIGRPVIVTGVPGVKSFNRMPARVMLLGPSASKPHVVTLPSGPLTSTSSHECGFVNWNSFTTPLSVTSLVGSNIAPE